MNSNDFTWVLKSFDKDSRDFGSCLGSRGFRLQNMVSRNRIWDIGGLGHLETCIAHYWDQARVGRTGKFEGCYGPV